MRYTNLPFDYSFNEGDPTTVLKNQSVALEKGEEDEKCKKCKICRMMIN